jgi:hypothetical protein
MKDGEVGELEPRGRSGLVEDAREMMLDGLLADCEFLRDVAIGVAGDDRLHDVELPPREAEGLRGPLRVGFRQLCDFLDEIGYHVAVDPVLALHHDANTFEQEVGPGILENDAPRSEPQRSKHLRPLDADGEQNNPQFRQQAAQPIHLVETGMSSNSTSGWLSVTIARASAAVPASPTTAKSGARSSSARRRSRNIGFLSTITRRIGR